MSTRLKALRALVKVRERQGALLERSLAAARAQLAAVEDALAAAETGERASVAAEQGVRAELDAMTLGAFTPHALRTLDFRIADAKGATAQAARGVADAGAAVQRQNGALAAAHFAVKRNQQRIEAFREQIGRLERERAERDEEQAEEETEEASTARFVARLQLARAEAGDA